MEIKRKLVDFIFLGSKITADGDCTPEIKRCLLLGRKAMINLDSILKSGDVTLWTKGHILSSVQSLNHVWLCESMGCSTTGFPVHHQLSELTQTQVLQVADATQPSHPLSSQSPTTFSLSQHQGIFQWVSSSHPVTKVLELHLQNQSCQWIFRTDCL